MGGASLPPGFRFHPTDEELIGYYLKRKVDELEIELEVIPVIDLYKFDPWDLPEKSFLPKRDLEWFFFCPRDRKYPNGSRTNRATKAGYWKATGKDKKVVCQSNPSTSIMKATGYRKTLVFYRGRAPLGDRTDWVMHEYRLCDDLGQDSPNFQGAYALCRVIKKNDKDKVSDYKGKRGVSSSKNENESSMRLSSSKENLSISADISSQASQLCSESRYSSPIASPCADNVAATAAFEPPSVDTNPSSFLVSPDMILDSSKDFAQAQGVISGYLPHNELLSAMTPWQSLEHTEISSSSSYSTDELGLISRMSPYSGQVDLLDFYRNEDVLYEAYDQINSIRDPRHF